MSGPVEIPPPGPDELLVVVGPTGSGKTDLAMSLAQAWDAEVVGADSVQLYRYFDIGSGKPSPHELGRVRHHLVDCCDPLEHCDAARFAELAELAIADIRQRRKIPIVCGGTYLWVRALLYGLAPSAPADEAIRRRHREIVEQQGRASLHAELAAVDPARAAELSPNDFVRVSRALEVYALTGCTQSVWHAQHGFRTRRHAARLVGVERPREELDRRIAERTQAWLDGGWVDEVNQLIGRGYGEARAMRSVGYRQVRDNVEGRLASDELCDAILRATRTLVRRQRTWLRDQDVTWLTAASPPSLVTP